MTKKFSKIHTFLYARYKNGVTVMFGDYIECCQ